MISHESQPNKIRARHASWRARSRIVSLQTLQYYPSTMLTGPSLRAYPQFAKGRVLKESAILWHHTPWVAGAMDWWIAAVARPQSVTYRPVISQFAIQTMTHDPLYMNYQAQWISSSQPVQNYQHQIELCYQATESFPWQSPTTGSTASLAYLKCSAVNLLHDVPCKYEMCMMHWIISHLHKGYLDSKVTRMQVLSIILATFATHKVVISKSHLKLDSIDVTKLLYPKPFATWFFIRTHGICAPRSPNKSQELCQHGWIRCCACCAWETQYSLVEILGLSGKATFDLDCGKKKND